MSISFEREVTHRTCLQCYTLDLNLNQLNLTSIKHLMVKLGSVNNLQSVSFYLTDYCCCSSSKVHCEAKTTTVRRLLFRASSLKVLIIVFMLSLVSLGTFIAYIGKLAECGWEVKRSVLFTRTVNNSSESLHPFV